MVYITNTMNHINVYLNVLDTIENIQIIHINVVVFIQILLATIHLIVIIDINVLIHLNVYIIINYHKTIILLMLTVIIIMQINVQILSEMMVAIIQVIFINHHQLQQHVKSHVVINLLNLMIQKQLALLISIVRVNQYINMYKV